MQCWVSNKPSKWPCRTLILYVLSSGWQQTHFSVSYFCVWIFHSDSNGYTVHSSVLTHTMTHHKKTTKTPFSGMPEDNARQLWKQTSLELRLKHMAYLLPRASSRMENGMLLLYQYLQARGSVLTATKAEENGMRLTGLPSASYFRPMHIWHMLMLIDTYLLQTYPSWYEGVSRLKTLLWLILKNDSNIQVAIYLCLFWMNMNLMDSSSHIPSSFLWYGVHFSKVDLLCGVAMIEG